MDPFIGLLFVAGVLWASKNAIKTGWAEFRKSRAGKKRGPWQHAVAWWAREASQGFPVHRAGFSQGWLAHQTALAHRQAQREEARTSHLEARASIATEWAGHRRRQAEAQTRIDEALKPEAGDMVLLTARSKSGKPVNRLTGEPQDTVAVHGKDDLDRRLAAAADNPDIEVTTRRAPRLRPVPSPLSGHDGDLPPGACDCGMPACRSGHPDDAPPIPTTTNGAANMATATEGSYTTVLQSAKTQSEQADYAAADVAKQRADAERILEEMEAANVDGASISAQADHVSLLRKAEEALSQIIESGAQVATGLTQRHGGIKEAHDDAPVEAAESGWYQD